MISCLISVISAGVDSEVRALMDGCELRPMLPSCDLSETVLKNANIL